MQALLQFCLFLIGLVFLIKGADYLVSGSVSFAKRLKIPDLVIGLTIVAFGTSAPELIVSVFSALSGTTDIAVGNVVGSNISNTLLILGVSAAIYPLSVHSNTIWKEIPFSFLASCLMVFLALDHIFSGVDGSIITRGDGLVLLSVFSIFLYYIVASAKRGDPGVQTEDIHMESPLKTFLAIGVGMAGLAGGGYMMVEAAKSLAYMAGISEQMVGLTIVAIGTSLPELATSVVAAMRKQSDIAIGNVVGSNIFNILWILGLTSVVLPLPVDVSITSDIVFMLITTIVLFGFILIGKRHELERWQGVGFVLLYIFYIISLVIRA